MTASRTTRALIAVLMLAGCASQPKTADELPLADASDASVTAGIEAVTRFPTELDSRLWNGTDLKPEVRERTMKIVDRVVATSGVPGLTVDAVELFGSNASYEYDDASDFGVHVFTRSATIAPEPLAKLLKLLNDDVERRQEGHILFNGVPVEVTFHSERGKSYQPSPGIGQYSISDGRWIERPVRQPDNFDRDAMAADMTRFIGAYNDLVNEYARDNKAFECSRFGDLDSEMGAYRDSDFAKGLGSRSTSNLTYRALRRINVNIPSMLDTLEDECTFTHESIG
jgi:hypothetical protein